MQAIKCPYCNKIQPLNPSKNYGGKCLFIFICILLAVLTAAGPIISICFLLVAFSAIFNIKTQKQICNKCHKSIIEPHKYSLPSYLLIKKLHCCHDNIEEFNAINSLVIAAAYNDKEKFLSSFKKIHFDEFPIEENEKYLNILHKYKQTSIRIQSISLFNFKSFTYNIEIDQEYNIKLSPK